MKVSIYNVYLYALIANDVYEPLLPHRNKPLDPVLSGMGWVREDLPTGYGQPSFAEGFYASLYHLEMHGRIHHTFIIAFRGTEISWQYRNAMYQNLKEDKNIVSDSLYNIQHKNHMHHLQYEQLAMIYYINAKKYIDDEYITKKKITLPYTIKFVGHSLGGAIAQILAANTHNRAISFNAPSAISYIKL